MMKRLAIMAVLVGVAVGLVSCTGPQQNLATGPYADLIAQARDQATSQFERDVLADGEITRAEYEEAIQRFVTCVADEGATVKPQDQAGYYVYAIEGDVALYDKAADKCAPGTKALIEGLYVDMLTNPNNRDYDELIAECFVKAGLVAAPFTKSDLQELLTRAGAINAGQTADSDQVIDKAAEDLLATKEADQCMANPSIDGDLEGSR
ncbi:hypothetical protein ACIQLK_05720 [Microbacterium sp. NPDC091382]|uniref:hypothetical protein n=1 Tax=Microbacterium sp. NPDC091382 TaxID=3364210 RepID=UPI003829A9D6